MSTYFAENIESASKYDCIKAIQSAAVMPAGLVDFGTSDEYLHDLEPQNLFNAIGQGNHTNVKVRWQEGYDHGFYFVSTFYEEHIAFHAHHLYK